eukprot:2984834-Rhodomonas_salina.1
MQHCWTSPGEPSLPHQLTQSAVAGVCIMAAKHDSARLLGLDACERAAAAFKGRCQPRRAVS